jgi:hypothetical protein
MSVNGQKYKAVFRHSQKYINISPLFAKKKKNLQLTNIKNKKSATTVTLSLKDFQIFVLYNTFR